MLVRDELRQPTGVVHGGVYASIAEALASFGTNVGVYSEGKVGLGMSNHSSFLRPVRGGTSTPRRAGATVAARPGSGTSTSPTTRAACAR